MVKIAPMDTGSYEGSCNSSLSARAFKSGKRPGQLTNRVPVNCDGWSSPVVGTLAYHDHIILANLALYSGTESYPYAAAASSLFARSALADASYSDLPSVTNDEISEYYEANIVGNPSLPDGVRFLAASFSTLFGTDNGKAIQALCKTYGWPLVWYLGSGGSSGGGSYTYDKVEVEVTDGPSGG
eukprot:2530311-Prymnesium_polylepis.1